MSDLVIAADLGGTNLRMAVVGAGGSIIQLLKAPTPSDVSPRELVELIGQMAGELKKLSPAGGHIRGVAFTAPAPVAKDFDGILRKLPNLPGLTGMDLGAELLNLFDLPVTIENDATAAAIGENWIGASSDVENSICVTLGTGIGGGVIVDGEPIRGKDGTGGEIGHICVEPDGVPCGCGSHGCVEQYASGTAIVRMAREAGMDAASSAEVYAAWENGDERAVSVFGAMGRYLGITLAGLVNTLNPDMLVICGGVTGAWDAFAGRVETEIADRAYSAAAQRARLVRGSLDDTAGIVGVARSAFLSL